MAIVYTQQNKRQKLFIFIIVACVVLMGVILWFGFSREQKSPTELYIEGNPEAAQEKINIDFTVLDNPLLKELQPFSEIEPLAGAKGRENPFIPY